MKMRTDRLMLVAAKLRTVPPEQFDMDIFAENPLRARFDCQTTACAAGWATTVPALRRAGLRIGWEERVEGIRHAHVGVVFFGQLDRHDALATCFGLDFEETKTVFYRGSGMSPKEKAEQIETLCRRYEEAQGTR